MSTIIDESKSYFFMIPNLIDEMGLSVYAFRLYCHFKRVTGESGECWQSTATISEACQMSTGSVSNAKAELAEAGLIRVEKRIAKGGARDSDLITITDIWEKNRSKVQPISLDEGGSSPGEGGSSPHETKNTPIKNTPVLNEDAKNASSSHPPAVELFLSAFNAKRVHNKIQYDAIVEMERKYGIDLLREGVRWAAINGMAMGRAISAIEKALPNWGKVKAKPGGNGNGRVRSLLETDASIQSAVSYLRLNKRKLSPEVYDFSVEELRKKGLVYDRENDKLTKLEAVADL